ncbi:MAG: SRPBCC family protein [Pseudolabrys sp.]|nr:SRPBCC family protein [Pseudolabrys sp.]
MLKIVIIVLGAILIAIGVVLILAAFKPDTFRVQRSTLIYASPEKVYPLIADFRQWTAWSPYERKDPAMKRTYSGAPSGVGAMYAWDGNKEIGAGSMEIVQANAPANVGLKLDFSRPFEAHNNVVFSLTPQADGTVVTWDMQGPSPFIGKIMHVFFNMDRMVGSDFEVGLANLKAEAEKK